MENFAASRRLIRARDQLPRQAPATPACRGAAGDMNDGMRQRLAPTWMQSWAQQVAITPPRVDRLN